MEKKTKTNLRDLIVKHQGNRERLAEIADICERENRKPTESEQAEADRIADENRVLQIRMNAHENPATSNAAANRPLFIQLREALQTAMDNDSKNPVKLCLTRDIQTTADLAGTGIIPVQEQAFLKPLRAGLIWDKVGLNIGYGLVGTLRWPKHGKITAQFKGEAEALTTQSIDWDKIEIAPKRLGLATDATRQEIFQSEGRVESVIREEMPQAIADAVNAHLFTTDKTGKVVWGPFATAGQPGGCAKKTISTAVPKRKDLLKAKATIAGAGINPQHLCWVMTESMKAELEDTPVDAGSGRFLCENDRILGYPVFTTDVIGEYNIGLGDWSYQAAGFFGQSSFVIDPYTLALNDSTRFVLNTDFATVTLRPEAFVLIACTAPKD